MPKDGTPNRERILDAAQQLVIENGFAATSVDQVLSAAGTSKGASADSGRSISVGATLTGPMLPLRGVGRPNGHNGYRQTDEICCTLCPAPPLPQGLADARSQYQ